MGAPEAKAAMQELARRELERRQQSATQKEAPGMMESAGRGLAQGVSFGFADEASAGISASMSGINDTIANFVNGKMEFGDFVGAYRNDVEAARAADAAAQEANPKTFAAGQVVGTIAPVLATGGAAAAGRGALGAVKLGAGLGGLAAAGASEADLTQGDVGGLAEDVLLGSALGAATGVGGELVSKGLGAAGRVAGRTQIGQKIKDIAANVIKPKAIAADLRNAAKASTKKAFDPRLNKNLERGIEGLQKRGLIPSERSTFQNLDKRELYKTVRKESSVLGESIEKVGKLADEAGVDFGSNTVGIKTLRDTAKTLRKSSTSDEFKTSIDNVAELLNKDQFKATDLQGIKRELDGLIKTGSTLKSIKKSQMSNLMKVRTQIKDALEDKIDDAASRSPKLQAELDSHDVKNFAELNDAFGDTSVVRDTLADAAAIADFEEGAFQASPLSEQISNFARQEGLVSAITGGLGRGIGAASEKGVRAGATIGRTVRAAAQVEKQSALVARQLYQSMDEDNVLNDDIDRKAHAGRVLSNPTLSHAQKFREINMLQSSGKINPDSIPQRDKRQVMKEIEAMNKALEDEVLRGL